MLHPVRIVRCNNGLLVYFLTTTPIAIDFRSIILLLFGSELCIKLLEGQCSSYPLVVSIHNIQALKNMICAPVMVATLFYPVIHHKTVRLATVSRVEAIYHPLNK